MATLALLLPDDVANKLDYLAQLCEQLELQNSAVHYFRIGLANVAGGCTSVLLLRMSGAYIKAYVIGV